MRWREQNTCLRERQNQHNRKITNNGGDKWNANVTGYTPTNQTERNPETKQNTYYVRTLYGWRKKIMTSTECRMNATRNVFVLLYDLLSRKRSLLHYYYINIRILNKDAIPRKKTRDTETRKYLFVCIPGNINRLQSQRPSQQSVHCITGHRHIPFSRPFPRCLPSFCRAYFIPVTGIKHAHTQ